jgi:hypothetical protein
VGVSPYHIHGHSLEALLFPLQAQKQTLETWVALYQKCLGHAAPCRKNCYSRYVCGFDSAVRNLQSENFLQFHNFSLLLLPCFLNFHLISTFFKSHLHSYISFIIWFRSKPTFLKTECETYEITNLSVSVSPLITFEPIGRFLWNSGGRSCHWRWPRRRTFNHSKMAVVQTSEGDSKLAPVNVGSWNFVYW